MSKRSAVMVYLVRIDDPRDPSGFAYWDGEGVVSAWRDARHYASKAQAQRIADQLRQEGEGVEVEAFLAPGINEHARERES